MTDIYIAVILLKIVYVIERVAGLFHYEEDESAQKLYFSERSHALRVLEALNEQRRQHVLCDVIVCVDDQEFACHRSVLAACSPYFFAMFSSKSREFEDRGFDLPPVAPLSISYEMVSGATQHIICWRHWIRHAGFYIAQQGAQCAV